MSAEVILTAVTPPGATVRFALAGDATLSHVGGTAWTTVQRPRQRGFVEFTSIQLSQMVLPLILDTDDGYDVEGPCTIVDSWRLPGATRQPPTLALSGPVPVVPGNPGWVLQTIGWGAAIRRSDGLRTQQAVTLTLIEFGTAQALTSPAQVYVAATTAAASPGALGTSGTAGSPAGSVANTYTVRAGDTLWAIAGSALGNYARWPEIATKNGIRDPRSLAIGTVLVLP